uniref:probable transcriptional regulator Ycf29 n=1 Tax=Anunuuluaehu liula TaxID=3049639 RepID=UPI0030011F76
MNINMKRKLLLVDDDAYLRNSISAYLISEGFSVYSVDNVSSALLSIRENKPDLIIADIMMPNIDGYHFIIKLKGDNELCSIPVIFLTAKGMTSDRIKGYNLGCNAYLVKPFDPKELLSIINNLFKNIALLKIESINTNGLKLMSNLKSCMINFTNREETILQLVVKGFTNKEIASFLNVSIRNVEKYVSRLLNKTSTRNRTELAKFVISSGIELIEGE